MKHIILWAGLMLCLDTALWADETAPRRSDANLYGHVVDKRTGEHLPYATLGLSLIHI